MSTGMLLVLIIAVFWKLARMERKGAEEDWLVGQLVKEARHSKPRMMRNPARFGTVGFRTGRRRRWYGFGRI